MKLEELLQIIDDSDRFRRSSWHLSSYIRKEFNDIDEEYQFVDDFHQEYSLTPEDVLAYDWKKYSDIAYVALYMQNDGIPGHYVISEEEYNNKQFPDLSYMTDWIRFEGK